MNHQIPSVDQFLATSEPDEDDTPDLPIGPGTLWQLPPDPMERVASALEQLTAVMAAHTQLGTLVTLNAAEKQTRSSEAPHDWARKAAESAESVHTLAAGLDDLEAKHQTVLQVISDVEAALGKSKAAPALAAKAVIDAWRNPQVPETAESVEGRQVVAQEADDLQPRADLPSLADMDELNEEPRPDDGEYVSTEGHTRTPHPEGPDFCRECSGELQEWVRWPCPQIPAPNPEPVVIEPQQPVQPAHNAPVEEWRAYARALGYAGPEIDKANRSVIRTTLGIAQPVPEAGA